MTTYLEIARQGDTSSITHPIGSFAIVGRSSDCHVKIADDNISRKHFSIDTSTFPARLKDLESKNGTYLNGQRISDVELRSGDRIQIGETILTFVEQGDDDSRPGSTRTLQAPVGTPSQIGSCKECGRPIRARDVENHRALVADGGYYCIFCNPRGGLSGMTVGSYRVIERIGRGAWSEVYKAEHVHMERHVALKVLHAEFLARPEAIQRFLREAKLGGRLAHPNIVTFYDTGTSGEVHYIALEYVEGQDLLSVMNEKGVIAPEEALAMGIGILDALGYAHEKGVIHRDIKPGNVLYSLAGEVKVTDFGLSRALESTGLSQLTEKGRALGTVVYMAPEQIDDSGKVDHRADLYSVGATLFRIMTADRPYPAKSLGAYLQQVRDKDPLPVSSFVKVPPRLDEVIFRSLAKTPEKRYQSALEMKEALRLVLGKP